MKQLLTRIEELFAEAALLEMGVDVGIVAEPIGVVQEHLEDILIEVAFAEAADYDDIHAAIQREGVLEREMTHPADCDTGGNDLCFV